MKRPPISIENILIVCVGNICRSPMAEAVMRDGLKDTPRSSVSSAGLGALVGRPAVPHVEVLMSKRGLDISTHEARQLTRKLVDDSDLVLVMESSHRRAIEQEVASAYGKVFRLCHWQDLDIPDPYRQPIQVFEETLQLIDLGVKSWIEKLNPQISSNSADRKNA